MRRFLILAMIFSIGLFAQLPGSLTSREQGKFYALANNSVALRVLFFAPDASGSTLPGSLRFFKLTTFNFGGLL